MPSLPCRIRPLPGKTTYRGSHARPWRRTDKRRGRALLDHVAALPFEVAGLVADRGFYNGTSIERLDTTAPVALPVIRRGKQMAEKLDTTVSYWTEYVMCMA